VREQGHRHDVVMNVPAGAPAPVAAPAPAAAAVAQRASVPEAPAGGRTPALRSTPKPLFAVGDIGWMNGTSREKAPIFDTKFFTPEIRLDVNYLQDFNHPIEPHDRRSTEEFRSG